MKRYTYVNTLKDGRLTRERVYRDSAWEDQMRSRLSRTIAPWYRVAAAALSKFFWRLS